MFIASVLLADAGHKDQQRTPCNVRQKQVPELEHNRDACFTHFFLRRSTVSVTTSQKHECALSHESPSWPGAGMLIHLSHLMRYFFRHTILSAKEENTHSLMPACSPEEWHSERQASSYENLGPLLTSSPLDSMSVDFGCQNCQNGKIYGPCISHRRH